MTQPPGPVILLGHSMGGLLAAEAATDLSNAPDERTGKPRRIIGVIAFDAPYLGMHPHVIISGIASLLPKDTREQQEKLKHEMDVHPDVTVVPGQVTDDWERVRPDTAVHPTHSRTGSVASSHLTTAQSSTSTSSWSFQSVSPFFDRVRDFASEQVEGPLARWLKKHSDDPLSAGKRWIVERLQFPGAMFDPSGLKERYTRLVNWQNGVWINYWTQTLPKGADSVHPEREDDESKDEQVAYNNMGLVESGIVARPAESGSVSSSIEQDWLKEIGKLKKIGDKSAKNDGRVKGGRHFTVLPMGLGKRFGGEEKWEKVIIGGAGDEVAAHLGLFIRGQNLDYDGLVDKVGQRILQWCQ